MAKTFLQLTNRVLKALNEVELDASNFASADGFSQEAKDSVNAAIFDLYTEEDVRWPFAWAEASFNTVVGTNTYTPVADATSIDWNSFRVNTDAGNNISAEYLALQPYKTYLKTRWKIDEELETGEYAKPRLVVRTAHNTIILSPVPDLVYSITYEYFAIPSALVASSDSVDIPDSFEQLIVDKALHYAYMFRDNIESAALVNKRYEDNVNKVRRILIPQFENVTPLG